jgi:hypothetical protein
MGKEVQLLRSTWSIIQKDFQISDEFNQMDISDEEQLERLLSQLVADFLDQDLPNFLNACYKIDLAEEKVKEILTSYPPNDIVLELARLIIAREKQKIISRARYRA